MALRSRGLASEGAPATLATGAVGLREVLFQSITDMAPAAAVTASIPAGAGFAGGSLPLAVILALVASLLCASCVGELAARLPSSGSLATYAARGLHPAIGFLVGWGYAMAAALIAPLVLLQLGFTTAGTIHSEWWSGYPADLWWPWTIAGAALVLAACLFGVRASTDLGVILGLFEVVVLVAVSILFIVSAGHHNTAAVFGTGRTPAAHKGLSGVVAGSVFTVLAFAGFEGAAPLSEEVRDPRRTIRRAVLLATLLVGILYVLTTYAADVAYGPRHFDGFGISGAASWQGLAQSLWGVAWIFVFLAVVNSTIANANAGANASSRTTFAMARIGAVPLPLARLNSRRSPATALALTTVVGLGIALGLGFGYDPVTAFSMVGTGAVIILAGIYIVVDAACIGWFLRHREELHVVRHIVVPVLGIAAFVPAWLNAAGITAFSFISKLTAPVSYMGPAAAVWMLLGVAYLLWHRARDPKRITAVGDLHVDDPATAA